MIFGRGQTESISGHMLRNCYSFCPVGSVHKDYVYEYSVQKRMSDQYLKSWHEVQFERFCPLTKSVGILCPRSCF